MTDLFAKVKATHRDTSGSLEIDRIVHLPVIELPTPEEVEAFCQEEVQARYFDEGFRLFPTQVGSVLAYDLYDGGFFPVGVGWGKTLITLMIANRAYESGRSQRSILYIPPQVYPQLVNSDISWARKRVGLRVPFILLGGKGPSERKAIAGSGKRGCYVMPYSYLSTRDAEDVLFAIQPDLIILDEAHNVKNPSAARTMRLNRYLRNKQPRIVALSGTITSKSIHDYHHLISHALRENSPLPLDPTLANNWSFVLDAGADPSEGQTGPITPLIRWCRGSFPATKLVSGIPGFRQAYKLRLNSAPGVVATGDSEIGVSLILENQPVEKHEQYPDFARLKRLMDDVEELWRTPSGDEIEWGFHKWRYQYELSAGFYHHLRWPNVAELVEKQKLSTMEAEAYLALAQQHHLAQQLYHRELRRWIEYSGKPCLDTPLLIGANMAQHGDRDVGAALYVTWRGMKDLEFDGMPARISEPIRVCDYKILSTVEWAKQLEGGVLIWYLHNAVGRWLYEKMQEAGLDPLWCPSESTRPGSNVAIGDPANSQRKIIASMGGHGTGKNLQHFQQQRFLQFPREADRLEQVLGRTHRNGQQADELTAHTFNTLPFDHMNVAACLVDALYIHQTTGSRQKAIYATWNPLPKMYPIDFLRERGFVDVKQLDADARAALEEKFGSLEQT